MIKSSNRRVRAARKASKSQVKTNIKKASTYKSKCNGQQKRNIR